MFKFVYINLNCSLKGFRVDINVHIVSVQSVFQKTVSLNLNNNVVIICNVVDVLNQEGC